MGTPEFAGPSLRALAGSHQQFKVAGVVTQPDRPAGRGGKLAAPAAKGIALELGLPLIQPEKLGAEGPMDQLRAWAPDVIVVAAFGQILRPEVLELPPFGCVNVHGSLLPRWRGAAPVQAAILAGDAETGVTIMKMDAGIDTGPILSQHAVPIIPDDKAGSLLARLATLGAGLLLETLPRYLAGDLLPRPQPAEGATYAHRLTKEDGRLDFARPATELARRVRAFNPTPATFFELEGRFVRVLAAHAVPWGGGASQQSAGTRVIYEKQPAVAAPDGLLVLDEVQPPGKSPMTGKAFLAGARGWAA
jgi:methionyl-tRNA formyltransferase